MRESIQRSLNRLDVTRITVAREFRGITKKDLALKIGKTPSAISQIERGQINPDLETFIQIALALNFPTSFFSLKSVKPINIDINQYHFRALKSTTQVQKRQCIRAGELLLSFFRVLAHEGVEFPTENISAFTPISKDPEGIASELRRYWELGDGPIPNLTTLVESNGILVLPIYDACDVVDGYATWKASNPCIMINYNEKNQASRLRFDVAHELAHIVMHDEISAGDSSTEREAHRFAGAFLFPKINFLKECPTRWNFRAFMELKLRWRMSIQAILYRAKDLEVISPSSYQRAMKDITIRKLRINEGGEGNREKPILIEKALSLLTVHTTLEELADKMSLNKNELVKMISPIVSADTLAALDRQLDATPDNIVRLIR